MDITPAPAFALPPALERPEDGAAGVWPSTGHPSSTVEQLDWERELGLAHDEHRLHVAGIDEETPWRISYIVTIHWVRRAGCASSVSNSSRRAAAG